ncbi:unnamed protein product [Rotaria sp. Silwood1]|nr:unnamed protein product [Rotaria sp. Silwood1]CAF3588834.1 unnamed protein product [Rotaria sp. Silwood1]
MQNAIEETCKELNGRKITVSGDGTWQTRGFSSLHGIVDILTTVPIAKRSSEKNAIVALQDSYTDLIKRIDAECSNRQRSSSTIMNNEHDKDNQSKKKHSQKQQTIKLNSTIDDSSPDQQRKQTIHDEIIHHSQNPKLVLSSSSDNLSSWKWSKNYLLLPFCFIIVNIFLCIKLNEIDQMTDRLSQKLSIMVKLIFIPKRRIAMVTDVVNELTKMSSGTSSNAPIDRLHMH